MLGTFNRLLLAAVALPAVVAGLSVTAFAEPVARSGPAAGAVIARKAGEEVRFIDVSNWRFVDLKQDLLTGDVLRTNETGQLAILFSDRTQVRLGRNSTLVVKQITAGTSADTVLQLQSGTIWARAERGGPGVQVQTPAAAAAIRGTDWTMTVKGSQTSLTVLEGLVQFSNPQGSVDVRQGEGAVASIGQAPRKIVIVDSDDREQMLYFLAPRNAFGFMAASPLPVANMRREVDRISAIQPGSRSTEDLLVLAETQLSLEGRQTMLETLALLESRKLSPAQRARLHLVKAITAASDRRYDEAVKLFKLATPGLDPKRRNVAEYGSYYARSLGDPNRVVQPPSSVNSAYSALLKAYATGFLKDIPAAIEVIRDAERKFPQDPMLPAARAQLAILVNDRPQIEEAIARSLALDPNEPTALEARANYRADFKSDLDGALADLQAALKVAPGSTTIWNALGNLQYERGDERAAEAALKKSIDLDPLDPLGYANLANIYMDQNRVEEARALIDKALELDPGFDLALIFRGRYKIQAGQVDAGLEDVLAGTVANPAYSAGQTVLAAAHLEKGDRVAAEQALDNADRLDDNDPVIAAARTALAIEDYDSEGAIRHAQDYVKRSLARGGDYSTLGANQQAGSTLNSAFRFQGLDSWAEYYSDAVFDPFAGTAYIDQAIRGSANPFANSYTYGTDVINNTGNSQAFSSLFQGLLLEPHLIASQSIGTHLFTTPFFETSLEGGFNTAGGEVGYEAEASVQGYTNLPIPISFSGTLQWQQTPDSRDIGALSDLNSESEVVGGSVFLSADVTPYDRLILYYNDASADFSQDVITEDSPAALFPFPVVGEVPLLRERDISTRAVNGGLGWSHTIGYKNNVNAAFLYSRTESRTRSYLEFDFLGLPIPVGITSAALDQETYILALNHTIASGDLTWRYGVEGGWSREETGISYEDRVPITLFAPFFDLLPSGPTFDVTTSDTSTVGRAYVDLLHEISPSLKTEYALFGSYVDSDNGDVSRLEPRIGLAWTPMNGQLFRAGFMRSSIDVSTPTLSPVGIVGLQPNQISVGAEGYVDTYALRWDAEWTPDFFTSAEFQHQELHDPTIPIALSVTPFSTGRGRIDRGSLTANLLLGHGFGLSSTVVYTDSEDEDPTSPRYNGPLPFIPEWAGQVALTWVNEANIRATLAANYVGERISDDSTRLGDYWTLDATLTWEPFDDRMELNLAAYNLLDEDFEVDTGTPGWGRSFKGTLKVRF
ncbi:TonB-dependent receptor [Neorhizobium sp. SOG26]|uniref:FecR domain-containing protein n=1 Tax=Neorhizobium sp. SOG26 TaxID=2060726 RepID=UPI000E58568B|nr:FecR domain-containing protein [Neorhizobium sp. SOG26]AXV15501.1 TonB-dependent receptor [Neorhizobium sp. SOG26]